MAEFMKNIHDAVAVLNCHPAVQNVGVPVTTLSGLEVPATIEVALPSRLQIKESTPEGIRALEPCWFVFSEEWPQKAPTIWLREDFPLSLPHINPHRAGQRVSPCLFEGSIHEILHRFGFERIVDQLSIWLSKAASGQLIDLAQGWEPTRRDTLQSTAVFSAEDAIAKTPMDGTLLVTYGRYFTTDGSLWAIAADLSSTGYHFTQDQQKLNSLQYASGRLPFIFLRCVDNTGTPRVVSEYYPETVVDFPSLLELATSLGAKSNTLSAELKDYANLMTLQRPEKANWSFGIFAVVVLLVHRPASLVGSPGRAVEVLPYVVRYTINEKNSFEPQNQTHPAYHAQRLTPALLSLASGIPRDCKWPRLVILGCGSLGSKVALHLGRTGAGNIALVDNEVFSPHNSARHALIPPRDPFLIPKKSLLMEQAFTELGHDDCNSFELDAANVLADSELADNIFGIEDAVIIDTTASFRVASAAALSQPLAANSSRRFVQTGMYAQGKVSYLFLEGRQRAVTSDDLRSRLFEICRQNEPLRTILEGESSDPTRIFVGDNCSSLTMPMTDSLVSRSAALVSNQLERWLTVSIPENGQLCYAVEDNTGIGMTWNREELLPSVVFPATNEGGWIVRVLESVARNIDIEAKQYGRIETGGALLGYVSHNTRTITLAGLVAAPPDSTRSESMFTLGTSGLVSLLKQANQKSLGHLQFAGTWHSHPMGGTHSRLDKDTLNAIAQKFAGLPAVSLVWTPTGLKCEVAQW
jgi:hypothetical protein